MKRKVLVVVPTGVLVWATATTALAGHVMRRPSRLLSIAPSRRRVGLLAALILLVTSLVALATGSTASAVTNPQTITVTVMEVTGVGDDLDGIGRSDGDFYVGVEFGTGTVSAARTDGPSFETHMDDDDSVKPFWPIGGTVTPFTVNNVPTGHITLAVWDHDDCESPFCTDTGEFESDDDRLDIKPGDGEEVTLTIDLATGKWSGGPAWPNNCVTGDGGEAVKLCFDISVDSTSGDLDGDGLLDGWERNGYDGNADGSVDVDLPGWNAKVDHKDLFLELDYTGGQTPSRASIQAMKLAFAAAPLSNPDGSTGINLRVDTGGLVDPTARETQAAGTCSDGINNGGDAALDGADTQDCVYLDASVEDPLPTDCNDGVNNDGDGLVDGADPDCLVGDNLGGGNAITALNNCGITTADDKPDPAFTNAEQNNFSPTRMLVFRYAISTASDPDTDGNGPDTACGSGGQGTFGGYHFIEYNHDGGTIMHEFGHNLNLHHGGTEDTNCKPNYVSGMNYDLQFGIPRVGGGTIIDYSPPRIALDGSTRGVAPLGQLDEADLDENTILDGTDNANRFVFVDRNGAKQPGNLNGPIDWNADGSPPNSSTVPAININNSSPDNPATTNVDERNPRACASNTSSSDKLNGHDDWSKVQLPIRPNADGTAKGTEVEQDPIPTLEEMLRLRDLINTTDLSVVLADSPDPVAAGTSLTWTVTARNAGTAPASSTEVTVDLPDDVVNATTSVPCISLPGDTVRCNLGEVLPGAQRSFQVTGDIPADLVYVNGGPKTITATATVDNLAGPDRVAGNDQATTTTRVIAVADVSVDSAALTSPLEVLIGEPGTIGLDVGVSNAGPSSPIDTLVTASATADSGVTITPATTTSAQNALAVGTPRTVAFTASVSCTSPGVKTVTFQAGISLKNAPVDIDPVSTNNALTATASIDCVVPMKINVRPHGFPNTINLNTDATLAALTTTAGEYGLPLAFDATSIEPLSVLWGVRTNLFNVAKATGAPEIHSAGHLERSYELDESTRDADLDMVLHFKPALSGLTPSDTEACLKGKYTAPDGNLYTFLGCDSVRVKR